MKQVILPLADENATILMGTMLANIIKAIEKNVIVYLHGELGAGKTTLTRGFVRGMGHNGNVKSPTYTLVEPYELSPWMVYHFDLYRLGDPEELEYMGIRDYFSEQSCCFIEWPEKGQGLLPSADIDITIVYVDECRQITFDALSTTGQEILSALDEQVVAH